MENTIKNWVNFVQPLINSGHGTALGFESTCGNSENILFYYKLKNYYSENGDGNGWNYKGNDVASLNGNIVYNIDEIPTIITQIVKDVAKGFILREDLTLKPCYIVKNTNFFAHGDTIEKAINSLQFKIIDNLDIKKKIEEFFIAFPSTTEKYLAKDFYHWHWLLTRSCETGRNTFCYNNEIDLENDKYTVQEFLDMIKNQRYGNEIISKLIEKYHNGRETHNYM